MLVFLRVHASATVPDDPIPGAANLSLLFRACPGCPTTIGSPFAIPGYSREQLITLFAGIVQMVQPGRVRTQDPAHRLVVDGFEEALQVRDRGGLRPPDNLDADNLPPPRYTNFYDYSDHVWGARFAEEALKRVRQPGHAPYVVYTALS